MTHPKEFVESTIKGLLTDQVKSLDELPSDVLERWMGVLESDLFDYLEQRVDNMLVKMAVRVVNPGKQENGQPLSVEDRGIRALVMEGTIDGANIWRTMTDAIRRAHQRRVAAVNFKPTGPVRRSGIRSATEAAANARRIFGEPDG